MKASITFEIECGETTCAVRPGKFCKFCGATRFGTWPVCMLFQMYGGGHAELNDVNGWVQRCESCLDLAKINK